MANYWAITIGINQYRHLQPLRHAQNDALFMHRFFVEEAGIPSDHCVLLSDLATSVGHQVVYPDKPAIAEWIHTITQQVESGDIVWVFFSGYGVQLEEADYLMPIDGDPGQIKDTGIAIADLISTLAQLPTAQTLLVLDINRSQGALAGQSIGTEVMDLAQQQQIPTLLSCQPEQYSHETLGVRHGLFTAALLEALQQNCTTLSQIGDYVTKRLPELCDHHWRPIQNLVSLVPEGQGTAAVVPEGYLADVDALTPALAEPPKDRDYDLGAEGLATGTAIGSLAGEKPSIEPPWKAAVIAETDTAIATPATDGTEVDGTNIDGTAIDDPDADLYAASVQPPIYPEETDAFNRYETAGAGQSNGTFNGSANGATASSAIVPYQKPAASAVSGAKLRNWGLLALALLVGGVLLKQPFVATSWEGLSKKFGIPTLGGQPQTDTSGSELADGSIDPAAAVDSDAAAPDSADGSDSPDAEGSSVPAAVGAATDSDTAAGEKQEQATGKALIARASNALKQRQYSDALIALQQVPQSQRDATFSSVLTQARAGAAEAQQANASVLTDARTAIQPTQASQFADAIAKARSIQPGEPYYEEAKQDIRSWSQIILDIAEGRATSGNLDRAIAAAGVMPYDNAEFHKKAQERIAFWQQRQRSRDIIFAARQIPASGQASTYQKGIVKLREVPIEHPEYETAQQLADEWSERIFSIAQARAAQGRASDAIQAAILVPAGTTAYEPAQQAIKRWQG